MSILLVLIATFAGLLLFALIAEWRHQNKLYRHKYHDDMIVNLSIVVAFRNEIENLPTLLKSLANQEHSGASIEFIFVDDHSEDGGILLIPNTLNGFLVSTYSLEDYTGKKAAIALARKSAANEWIVCLDADVVLPEKWLISVVTAIKQNRNAGMLVLPVSMKPSSFWGYFFAWEFVFLRELAVIFSTRPLMANAANLVIHAPTWKSLLHQVKGNQLASGDDIFLLQAFSKEDRRKVVCPSWNTSLCARTTAPYTFAEGIQQRVRWLKKPAMFQGAPLLAVIALTFWIGNFIWLSGTIFILLSSNFPDSKLMILLLVPALVVLWSVVSSMQFKEQKLLFAVPLILLIYPFYAFLLPFIAFCIRPTWKGRKI